MVTKLACVLSLVGAVATVSAQPTSDSALAPPANRPKSAEPTRFALTNATVHVRPGEVSLMTTVLVADGRIERVARPTDADALVLDAYRVVDATGLHVYPGFVDAWVPVETPDLGTSGAGRHWSGLVQPDRDVLGGSGLPESDAKRLRKLGFVAAGISPENGIFRGSGAVVSTAEPLGDESAGRTPVYRADAFDAMGFDRVPFSRDATTRNYPGSHMGIVAMARQVFLDAAHRRAGAPHADQSALDAVAPGSGPTFWNTSNELEALLADKVFGEFGYGGLVLVGSGVEYERLDALAQAGHPVVVPLRFPAKPDLSSVGRAEAVSLSQLMAWEQAPANLRYLSDAGLEVAITSGKLPDGAKFHENLRRAVDEGGLGADRALAMLTTVPAALLGVDGDLGTIEPGKAASFVVADGPLFDEDTKLRSVWVDGREHTLDEPDEFPLDGDWRVHFGGEPADIGFTFKKKKVSGWEDDQGERESSKARETKIDGGTFSFLLDDEDDGTTYIISGTLQPNDMIVGSALDLSGTPFQYTALREAAGEDNGDDGEDDGDEDGDEEAADPIPPLPGYPFGPYAMETTPAQDAVLITGATIWTSGPDGVIENGYLYASGGSIIAVGAANPDGTINYQVPGDVKRIDATGMHLTPGLIDAHSHTGLFRLGVNESGQTVTAECRIADAIDPSAVNWYRQIAGGITAAQMLHGSANPIGGQSQTVKARWGVERPEDMFFEGAPTGIKFALGENVKQSNWGDRFSTRYPQTRMGVDTLIRDRFHAAREYASRGMRTESGRRDLELETLAEILAGQRFVHSHSYRQDEILMLCRVAEDFGFTIGTFQHGLEVYKVAEAVREHAIGASIFSDWWGYKVEVQDSIAQGGPLAHEAGVLMSYNSDSDDLARRMNLEAAKAVKYSQGRLSQEEALKFVTINPAIQLGIDRRVGSLEPGKDADMALWSGNPLSAFSRCEATYIDGREYFSTSADAAHRERNRAERERLIQKIIAAPDRDEDETDAESEETPGEGVNLVDPPHLHGLDLRSGNAGAMGPGDCGCETIGAWTRDID